MAARPDSPTTTYRRVRAYIDRHPTLDVTSTVGELFAALGADIIAGQTGMTLDTPVSTNQGANDDPTV